ncbi:MAG: GNAT family N-acetyltransferase [Microthrixaceae bacterium]
MGTRPATAGDVETLVTMHTDALEESRNSRGGLNLSAELSRGIDTTAAAESIGSELHDADVEVIVGTLSPKGRQEPMSGPDEEAVLGYCVVDTAPRRPDGPPIAPTARLRELWVEPGARRIGLGSALLEAAIEVAVDRGCAGIESVALPGDRATKNFFEDHAMVARAIIVHRDLRPPDSSGIASS